MFHKRFLLIWYLHEIYYFRRKCIRYSCELGLTPETKIQDEWPSEAPPPIIEGYSMQTMNYANTKHFIVNCPESNLADAVKKLLICFVDESFPLGIPQMQTLVAATELIEANIARISRGENCVEGSSRAFYQLIPFKGDNQRRPPLVNPAVCNRQLKFVEKLRLNLAALLEAKEMENATNPMDNFLSSWLNVGITLVDHASDEFCGFDCVARNTQHPNVSHGFRLSEVFKINTQHPFTADIGNHHYLFHYSFPSNMLGILREGLLIAPKHIHCVNRLLGKGLYFWDSIANAGLQYSMDTVYILVCRVALGRVKTLPSTHYQKEDEMVQLNGYDSGLDPGMAYTAVRSQKITINDVPIFCGQMENVEYDKKSWFSYGKYIVPRENQCKIEYILKLDRK